MSGPTYTYTADTPQAATPMNLTAPVIRENFQAIAELISVNHGSFNSSDGGKHEYVTLVEQSSEPTQQTSQLTIYCQATGSPNAAEIFYTYPDSSTTSITTVEQLTDQVVPSTGTGTSYGTASEGYVTFPSGVTMMWGTFSVNGKSGGNGPFYFLSGTPTYKTFIGNGALSPTSSGTNIPQGCQLNGYTNTTNFYAPFYAQNPNGSSTYTKFNYFMMEY